MLNVNRSLLNIKQPLLNVKYRGSTCNSRCSTPITPCSTPDDRRSISINHRSTSNEHCSNSVTAAQHSTTISQSSITRVSPQVQVLLIVGKHLTRATLQSASHSFNAFPVALAQFRLGFRIGTRHIEMPRFCVPYRVVIGFSPVQPQTRLPLRIFTPRTHLHKKRLFKQRGNLQISPGIALISNPTGA